MQLSGGRSSVGRALDCDSSGRGFKPHRPPQFKKILKGSKTIDHSTSEVPLNPRGQLRSSCEPGLKT